ncbi:MAG: ThiF family adenylyltransferase [Desulfobacca sp.]|uniref:ThiF family adenylyltransferase n=1 Tax=Desulfobacca sp. TaxID=2067990 RepID=UPI0040496BE5
MTLEAVSSLLPLTQRLVRRGQECLVIPDHELFAWSARQGVTPWQAMATALAAGIFPASLERNFPALRADEQLRLWQRRALIVGVGGLGGFQAALLARLGLGRLCLADGDTFSPSNLNRQLFATPKTLGRNKAVAAAQYLQAIHPALELVALDYYLNAANLPRCLAQVHVVLDALDSLPARQDLFAAAQAAGLPLVHGAVQGLSCQVTTILPQDGDVFQELYGAAPAGAGSPEVLAPTVSLTASLQVQEAVRLLLGRPPAYHRILAYLDGELGRLELLPLD